MKESLIFIFAGFLLAFLSVFALMNIDFSTISMMTAKITQGPFQMLLLGMVMMALGTLLRRKTIR